MYPSFDNPCFKRIHIVTGIFSDGGYPDPDSDHRDQIMAWGLHADSLLYEMEYKNKSLVILKEGFYYVYSKVSFLDQVVFYHNVDLKTEWYAKPIHLLTFRKFSVESSEHSTSTSYLGGVFHLRKGDALSVKVSNAKVVRYRDNIFGAYMI